MNLIRFSVLGLGWFLAVSSLNANPCVNPKRTISGYSVDLRPLMEWWAEPKGPRPLSGWKHAHGRIVREVPLGWVVEGKVEGAPTPLIFLVKNPPRERLQKYRQLQNQLAQYTRAAESTQQYLQRPVCTDWYSYYLTQWPSPPISLADYRQASSTMTDLYNKLQAVRDELATMQDADGQFQLDAFALRLNEIYDGLPVYDHGSTAPFIQTAQAP